MAFAGVGKPKKSFVCLVSVLNIASLNAEKTTIIRGTNAKMFKEFSIL